MIIHQGYESLSLRDPVVTIGIFDGVHRGHRALLDFLVRRASESGGESAVITFYPHPRMVLEKNRSGLSFLSTMDEKKMLLREALIGHLIIIDFTRKFSRIKADEFVRNILIEKIGTRHLIVGHDHRFGYKGEGSFDNIQSSAVGMGLSVEKVEGLKAGVMTISSSAIRQALTTGNISLANDLLGYCYSIKGIVIEGKKLGRKLGFPTANIRPVDKFKLIPSDGVYAVEIKLDNMILPGMLSIGKNPTVNQRADKLSIEVNIFNFEGDIYGNEIELIFRHRLRQEKKFESLEQLTLQMMKDRADAISILEKKDK